MARIYVRSLLFLTAVLLVRPASSQMTVVNGASFNPAGPFAPGSFATVTGQNLCGQTMLGPLNSDGTYPLMLGGCSMTVNGAPAMLQYVSPTQMNFVVPMTAVAGNASLVVNNDSQATNGSMMIGPAGPGVFSLDSTGMGNGAVIHAMLGSMGPFSVDTNGQPTYLSIFLTGMDLSMEPVVTMAGLPVDVSFYGPAPGYPGLQQINIMLPPGMAGVGRVPMTVTSNHQVSNVTFITMLPTTAMMQGMPGWGSGMTMNENMPRSAEMSFLAFNPVNNTALVTDEAGDALRVISLSSNSTVATITLPTGSQARSVAVNGAGTLAAVALAEQGSVALVDLNQNRVSTVIGSGYYACRLAFAGASLLVTNSASGTVAVIDTNLQQVTRTVQVGLGASGIAVAGNSAIITNMQDGSISLLSLTDYSVTKIALPAGARPHEVAISTATNQAVITNPMYNDAFLLNLATRQIKTVDLTFGSGMGPGAVATNGTLAYVANQMTATVAVVDLTSAAIIKSFSVDPGPRALAVNAAKNQLLVLCEGTGTLDIVDLSTYAVVNRINATAGNRVGTWTLPLISSISPTAGARGTSFTFTVNGANFQGVSSIEFYLTGMGMGGGMMGGGPGWGSDPNIKVSNVSVSASGTQITASVQILPSAALGARQVRIDTGFGPMMGPVNATIFTVTQ